MGGYAPTNSIGPPAVQRNPEVMGLPVSQERREPRALALLLPLRRQGEVGRGCPRFGLIRKTPLPNPSGHRTQLDGVRQRSEEHTSELQSLMRISYAIFCLKKKTSHKTKSNRTNAIKIPKLKQHTI